MNRPLARGESFLGEVTEAQVGAASSARTWPARCARSATGTST